MISSPFCRDVLETTFRCNVKRGFAAVATSLLKFSWVGRFVCLKSSCFMKSESLVKSLGLSTLREGGLLTTSTGRPIQLLHVQDEGHTLLLHHTSDCSILSRGVLVSLQLELTRSKLCCDDEF